MSLVALAISILWLLIGIVVIGLVVYFALKVVRSFVPGLDPKIDQAVWTIVVILILIGVLSMLAGGGHVGFPALR